MATPYDSGNSSDAWALALAMLGWLVFFAFVVGAGMGVWWWLLR